MLEHTSEVFIMSKQKFYAVRKGKKPGIYLT
ncbi:viroplasmin family protein [Vibrio harveyi]|nr:viroplasmin family protein [Vibrio harveyi]